MGSKELASFVIEASEVGFLALTFEVGTCGLVFQFISYGLADGSRSLLAELD